ncbi:hypothetical protein NADFUDRAFT_46553 [Nadsonia fulvescens var. elongata DSM 6958]|uniref:BZIP domain-containing protein n=1 Tax=Nadsonia fulvescens var. elongata DSM 6958 TaxID=857566 RepID=A0A1E3PKQ7_9ASCO|nr:hypothetical protein NADFUDRAFT_46553 [Nadsonia fulvescens var. elongata DSM 6958]
MNHNILYDNTPLMNGNPSPGSTLDIGVNQAYVQLQLQQQQQQPQDSSLNQHSGIKNNVEEEEGLGLIDALNIPPRTLTNGLPNPDPFPQSKSTTISSNMYSDNINDNSNQINLGYASDFYQPHDTNTTDALFEAVRVNGNHNGEVYDMMKQDGGMNDMYFEYDKPLFDPAMMVISPESQGHAETSEPTSIYGHDQETGPLEEKEVDIINRRKAQNRAAQKAFRDRRIQKVRELQDQLMKSQAEKDKLAAENEQLKREHTLVLTENKVLLANVGSNSTMLSGSNNNKQVSDTSSYSSSGSIQANHNSYPTQQPNKVIFPVNDFYARLVHGTPHEIKEEEDLRKNPPSSIIYQSKMEKNETMLGPAAVWDKIVNHPDGDMIDFDYVESLLKGQERCEGFGPVYPLSKVENAIQMALENN